MTPEEQAAADAAKAAEAAKHQSRTYSEEEFKALIAQRDEVKAKLREREEAEKKAAEAKLLEEGKKDELLKAKDAELARLKGLEDRLKGYEAAEAARREKLLKLIPEKKRELYATAPLEILEDITETLTEKPPKTPKASTTEGEKPFEQMTEEEKQELKKTNYAVWKSQFAEWYKKRNGRYPPFQF